MVTEENKSVEVFGTKEVSVKEFMGSTDKSLMLLSDYEKAKQNLVELKDKHQARVTELVALEMLSPTELKELNTCRAELREPRYLIQNIEKNNISVFEAYKKTDKANLKELIEINRELEDIASDKIKAEDDRKKLEKEAEAKAEENRIAKIKKYIENIETYCSEIVQKMTFENMKVSAESIEQSLNAEYDFEEYDLLFDQVKARVAKSLLDRTNDITDRENQRLENEKMKQEIFQVRVNRLKEVGFAVYDDSLQDEKEVIDAVNEKVLNASASEFEAMLSDIKKSREEVEQAKRDAELQKQQDEQFEVRKNRLFEIGFNITDNLQFFFSKEFKDVSVHTDKVFRASVTEFEEIFSEAKQDVVYAKLKKESDDKKEKFVQRTKVLLDLGFKVDSENHNRLNLDGIWSYENEFKDYSDEQFEEDLVSIKKAKDKFEADCKKKADAENKARVKRLANDKKVIEESFINVHFAEFTFETENQEIKDFISFANLQIGQLKADLLTQLNDL